MRRLFGTISPIALFAITVLAIASVAACGNKSQRADKLVSDKDPVRGFMEHIPADTAYAFVSLQPLPLDILHTWFEKFSQPLSAVMPVMESALNDPTLPAPVRLIAAVSREFGDDYSAERVKELGLTLTPRMSLHGLGLMPVLRMDLGDPEKFVAFLDRVETNAGITPTMETYENHEFRSYSFDGGYTILAVQNRQVVFGATPARAATLFTPYALGAEVATPSMAEQDVLTPISTSYGFEKFGTGFIDLRRIFNQALEEGTSIHHRIFADGPRPQLPQECVSEVKSILAVAPRAVFGYQDITADSIRMSSGLELTSDLGARLAATKQPLPAWGTEYAQQAPLSASLGVDVGQLLDVVTAEAMRVQQQPFACSWFAELNNVADEVTTAISRVPAIVRNVRGAGMVVTDINDAAKKVEGLGVVSSANPSALLSFLRTFAPEFEHVTPDPSGIPFRLPEQEMLGSFIDPHVVLTAESLAVTSGARATDDAQNAIASTDSAGLFAFRYDIARMYALLGVTGTPMDGMLGTTEMVFHATEAGLFVDYTLELR